MEKRKSIRPTLIEVNELPFRHLESRVTNNGVLVFENGQKHDFNRPDVIWSIDPVLRDLLLGLKCVELGIISEDDYFNGIRHLMSEIDFESFFVAHHSRIQKLADFSNIFGFDSAIFIMNLVAEQDIQDPQSMTKGVQSLLWAILQKDIPSEVHRILQSRIEDPSILREAEKKEIGDLLGWRRDQIKGVLEKLDAKGIEAFRIVDNASSESEAFVGVEKILNGTGADYLERLYGKAA